MSHVRTQIRAAIVAALAPVGSVHASRVYPLQPDELPAFLVYSGAEEITADLDALERRYQVVVECVVSGDDVDTALDALIVSVEQAVTNNLAVGEALPLTIETSASVEGAKPIGRAFLTFEVLYRTSLADPASSL